jgi:hypothetical protein
VERWGGEVGGVLGWSGGVLEHNPNASPGSQRVASTLEWKVMSLLNVTAWPSYVAVKSCFCRTATFYYRPTVRPTLCKARVGMNQLTS